MIEFHSPYLIPIIFMALVIFVGFGMGNIWSEIYRAPSNREDNPAGWLLLIVPSLIGIFLILWMPTKLMG